MTTSFFNRRDLLCASAGVAAGSILTGSAAAAEGSHRTNEPNLEAGRQMNSTQASGERPPYPDDIDPESGFRLPVLRREDLDEEGKAAFDELTRRADAKLRGPAGQGSGLSGPGGITLYSPAYAMRSQATNWYLRFESGISGRLRELAILVAAREMDQQREWTGHVPMALREGLEPHIIDIVANDGSVAGLTEADAVVILLGREAIGAHKVKSETFARALKVFGPRMLVDVVALMSEYVSTGILISVFDLQPRAGVALLPPRRSSR